jgi:urea transport system substrate-binding protein
MTTSLDPGLQTTPSQPLTHDQLPEGAAPHETLDMDGSEPQSSRITSTKLQAPAFEPAATSAAFPYLAPPQMPGELGRLEEYRVLRVLGEGGMGIVFEAEDTVLARHVAIKVLRPEEADDTLQKRFRQEARLAASLTTERVVRIYRVGQCEHLLYIVMELLPGESLEACLDRERTLPLAEALRIGREVAEGLTAAHQRQLIHRDIKPANVWLKSSPDGESASHVTLLDFGIARPLVVEDRFTIAGRVVGTPMFMAPEQACGLPVDQRADLFSLGCLLYAMLAGDSPFARASAIASLHAVVNQPAESIGKRVPGLPAPLVQLVDRLLSKNPDERPNSAIEVANTLRDLEQRTIIYEAAVAGSAIKAIDENRSTRRAKLTWSASIGAVAIAVAALLCLWRESERFVDKAHKANSSTNGPAAIEASLLGVSNTSLPAAQIAATSETAEAAGAAIGQLPTIKVGIIHSLSGPMATSERCIVDAFQFAIDELNDAGGLLGGRQIEAVIRDGRSNEYEFAREAEDLITKQNVVTLFGGWRSPGRKMMEQVCHRHEHLLLYPTAYEGLEQSPYVIYLGSTPNQSVLPAVKWAFAFLNKRKVFLIGTDGVYSRSVHEIVKDELKTLGGTIVGEEYRLLGESNFADVAAQVHQSGADLIVNTACGIGNSSMFRCLREAGVEAASVPTISFQVTEEELRTFAVRPEDIAGDYAALGYFQSLPDDANQQFVKRFRHRFGASRVVNDPMVSAYTGMHLWAAAVQAAGSDDVRAIRQLIVDQQFEGPGGLVRIDHATRHAVRGARIGRTTPDMEFETVWLSPDPILPKPFPDSRGVKDWDDFESELFIGWKNHWRPNAPPRSIP